MSVSKQSGEIVRSAADVLDRFGWIRRSAGSEETGFCAIGAIHRASDADDPFCAMRATADFNEWLQETLNKKFSLPRWNDTMCASREELTGYMRKFADEVDPQCYR